MSMTEDQEVIDAAADGAPGLDELSKGELSDIKDVSVSTQEAVNRATARLEGRASGDDDVTTGVVAEDVQTHDVGRAEQGDLEMLRDRQAEGRKPAKSAKKK